MANMERYFKSQSPNEKFDVSMEIVDSIHSLYHGRFLKRGNRCWVPVKASDARTKVAQAIQYQRRKQLKVEIGLKSQKSVTTYMSCPKPPVLKRHKKYCPTHATFDTPAKDPLIKFGDIRLFPQQQKQKLARHSTKSPKQSSQVSLSLLCRPSIAQATATATFVADGGKSMNSLVFNSLDDMMINSFKTNHENNIDNCNSSTKGKHRVGAMRKQRQIESSIPLTKCASTACSIDTSGVHSLTDLDSGIFEPDDSTFCSVPL